ncbi:LytTR family transcriptional regulator DNA-binding domain-containing protein [Pontibacter silvestris]|uniref:LytTR family transcriptional regulator DNA-binding domain-containing protein n=1 Tax=Pontibacter silvestris TaxID=2305183 RepID=A0ABW4WZQ1_9BACT|nr:LytTR family DNA-binding domain-containing protein [Pontibacter silvestris]MCC9138906.1 LytTR family transcriptional regulator [Pontibacter silvestris]
MTGTFALYKSPLISGGYTFLQWNTEIMMKAAIVNLTVLSIARSYLIKLIPAKKDILTIKGDNKLDILKIKESELICVSNAQNYVEIFYINSNTLHSKLIRTSLKNLKEEFNFLLQVHRSHLINPSHFKSWKDSNSIYLTQMELPVSKTFDKELLAS